MRLYHFFDWDGLAFFTKSVVLLLIVVVGGRFALEYAAGQHTVPSLVLIQEARKAAGSSLSMTLSTTTSEHIIRTLAISDVVPAAGKFIFVDLATMVLTLYQDGQTTAKYPILAKGEAGTPYETPPGFYTALAKESDHFDNEEMIDLPWSVQFYGNYFIHGWPYAVDGSPVDSTHAGGDVRLSSEDALRVYSFADIGTGIFVHDSLQAAGVESLVLDAISAPPVSALSYLVADIDTGDVFLEQKSGSVFPIGPIARLMTALVANETITSDRKISIPQGVMGAAKPKAAKATETFFTGDLLYLLVMQSNNVVAASLAQAYGEPGFINWMNASAKSLDMQSTHFSDTSATSTLNVSTATDLFRLAAYLASRKSFILDIARTSTKDLIAASGSVYRVNSTAPAKNAMLSVVSVPINGIERRVAVIILDSQDAPNDAGALAAWFTQAARQGADLSGVACATCSLLPPYRKIQL